MTNLIKNKLILYGLIIAFLGFLDATYLTVLHYKNIIPPCTITSSCEVVLTSKYSVVGGVPVSALGSLFYLGVIILCLLILTNYKKEFLNLFYVATAVGVVVSLVLIYIQGVLLRAYCQYCLLSEIISFALLILALLKASEDKKLK